MSVAIPRFVRPSFLKRYFRLGRQWPYHSLADRVCGMVTDVLGQKSVKKNPVCETMVWLLPRLGQKPERRRPSSIKTSPYWWTTDVGVRIVAFRIAANAMAQTERGRIQLFNVWRWSQERKKTTKFAPFHSTPWYASIKATILTPASVVYQ